jgi:hypothetical protein
VIEVKTNHWLNWTQIAIEHEHEAHEARQAEIQSGGGQPDFGDAMFRETKASLIAVSAAAHALDALYGAVKPSIPIARALTDTWKANKLPREKWILETLRHGFNVGPHTAHWATELDWLFDLRDAAVHPMEKFTPPMPHPTGGTNVALVHATYTCEASTRAVNLLVDIARTCVESPRSNLQEVVGWAESMKNSVASFPARP